MFGKNACVVVLCNFMGDNKLLSEFVIILSQMKSCDCKTCKLKGIRFARAIEWYSRECERFFYFCEEEL